jgi:hypothetical protein
MNGLIAWLRSAFGCLWGEHEWAFGSETYAECTRCAHRIYGGPE